jgi:hypothetical protein
MKRYTITAYDANHNELWITIGTSFVGAEACRRTDRISDVVNTYELVKTGKIIDPETGLPVIRHRDPNTGQRTQGSRYVAYFRVYDNNTIFEIHITRHGRKAGVRNYQTRRDSDTRTGQIIGYPPVHTGPRIVNTGYSYQLIIGEGDPNGLRIRGNQNIDRWGDPVVHIATCHRVTSIETEGGWWGYTYDNHYTWDHCPLERATVADVHRHLTAIAEEMIGKYGTDITRW